MLLTIHKVLDARALDDVLGQLQAVSWRDGAETAGGVARAVKRNAQADLSGRVGANIRGLLEAAITDHPVMKAAAWPRRISRLMISRTLEGGGYGLHVDNALMGEGTNRLRTDLSFTLALNPSSKYEGGGLEIHGAGGVETFRPEAGDLVLYPSTSLHRVADLTAGERIVCVGWIESLVADGAAREILFDLENLRAELRKAHAPNSAEMLTLQKAIANLLRRWARP